jgi:DNA-binding NarL/FixJ family response regulator
MVTREKIHVSSRSFLLKEPVPTVGHGFAFVIGGTDAYMNKIILADNQAIFRAGTAKILAMEDDFRIIAQCPDCDRLYQAIDAFRGAVLMFAATLKADVAVLVERVTNAGSRAIAIVENNESGQPFLTAGVHGLVYRNVSGPALLDCARRVAGGERFQQPAINTIELPEEDLVGARVRDRLTPKEMKIVALIVQGCKNKEIAIRLGTTEQVVKNYLRSVYDKTGVSDRLELALFTIHHKILAEAAAAVGNLMMQTV